MEHSEFARDFVGWNRRQCFLDAVYVFRRKDMPVGLNGFRIWTQKAESEVLELCKCGWQGVTHYHFKGGSHKSFARDALEKSLGEKLYDWVDNKDGSVSEVRLKP